MPGDPTRAGMARLIDWGAGLKPETTEAELARACETAAALGVGQLCVQPTLVAPAVRRLAGRVAVVAVAGFPHGRSVPEVKAREAAIAVDEGAAEVDMVLNRGWLRAGDLGHAEEDVRLVVVAAGGRVVKVILETAALTDDEARLGCRIAEAGGARFVKTSTGFGYGGATVASVRLLVSAVGGRLGVKASGGIRTLADARAMLAAGATRLGTSAAEAILGEMGG